MRVAEKYRYKRGLSSKVQDVVCGWKPLEFDVEWERETYTQPQRRDLLEHPTTESRYLGQYGSKIRKEGSGVPTNTWEVGVLWQPDDGVVLDNEKWQ